MLFNYPCSEELLPLCIGNQVVSYQVLYEFLFFAYFLRTFFYMFGEVFEFVDDLLSSLKGVLGDGGDGVCLRREFIAVYIELVCSFHIGQIARPLNECSSTGDMLEGEDELGLEVNWGLSSSAVDPSVPLKVVVVGAKCSEGIECLSSVIGTECRWEGGRASVGGHCDVELCGS